MCPPARLWLLANETRGIVRAAASRVYGDRWIRTERAGAVHLAVSHPGRRDLIRCNAFFHPLLQRAEHVKFGGAVAPAAVRHARDHEQPVRIPHFYVLANR